MSLEFGPELRHMEMFNELKVGLLAKICKLATPIEIKAGTTLLKMGEDNGKTYCVRSGLLVVRQPGQGKLSESIAVIVTGEAIGDINLLMGQKHTADVVALTDCTLFWFDNVALMKLIDRIPALTLNTARLQCRRVMLLSTRFCTARSAFMSGRVASLILMLVDKCGEARSDATELIPHALKQGDLASLAGTSPSNLSTILGKMQTDRLIEYANGCIVILDRRGLELLTKTKKSR